MEKPTVIGYMKDQPRALRYTFDNKNEFIEPFVEIFKNHNIKKVLFFGSGTSYNASVIAAYLFKQIVGIDALGCYPTVFENYEKVDWTNTLKSDEILAVAISQSGTSVSTNNVMKRLNKECLTLALTEDLASEITKHVDVVTHLLCGKEVTPPETRGYTVTLLQLYLWAVEAAYVTSKIDEETYNSFIDDAKKLCYNFECVVEESECWYDANATRLVNSDRIYVLGYGVDFGSALEGQLKIGEMLRLPSIGYELEEFSHGPTMALKPSQSIIMFGSDDAEWERCLTFREIYKRYTPRVYLITYKDVEPGDTDIVFSLKTNKYLAPIMFTVPCQFVAAKGALDTDIDTNINPFTEEIAHFPTKK